MAVQNDTELYIGLSDKKTANVLTDKADKYIRLKEFHKDMGEPTGFIRRTPDTMGIIELCPDGSTVYRLDQNSNLSILTSQTVFGDGVTPTAERTLIVYPITKYDTLDVYIDAVKYKFSETKVVVFPLVSGIHYVYFDETGTLKTTQNYTNDFFTTTPMIVQVYGNADTGESVTFCDRRHGITMDGDTQRYQLTNGTRYVSGMDIAGLTTGGTTHGQLSSGVAYNEDIILNILAQTNLPYWHISNVTWKVELPADNLLGYTQTGDTYVSYNQDVAGVFQLTELASSNKCVIMFFAQTNDSANHYVKVIGQNEYGNPTEAAAAIYNEINIIYKEKLPTIETSFIYAIIVNGNGELEPLADGSVALDLRTADITGSGGGGSLVDDSYKTPTLLNGWVNFGSGFATTQYMKDANNIVRVKGLVKDGSTTNNIFVLPEGYRPLERHLFASYSNTGVARVDVSPDGGVYPAVGGNAYFSLELSFKAEQ